MIAFKYGQVAESQAINAFIYLCFEEFEESAQQKFVKLFRQQPYDQAQVMHTFRELILGAYLHRAGFRVLYAQHLQGKTPDWVIVNEQLIPLAIVELVNFHIDRQTEMALQKQSQTRPAVVGYWRDGNVDNIERLRYRLQEKAQVYQDLVTKLAYVIAVFGEFEAALDVDDIVACLNGEREGLFDQYPHVSGVLFFDENGGKYRFQYFENPANPRKLEIPAGIFSRGS